MFLGFKREQCLIFTKNMFGFNTYKDLPYVFGFNTYKDLPFIENKIVI